jgi:hypothetical protein
MQPVKSKSSIFGEVKRSIIVGITLLFILSMFHSLPISYQTDTDHELDGTEVDQPQIHQGGDELSTYGTRAGTQPNIYVVNEAGASTYASLLNNLGYTWSYTPTTTPTAAWLQANVDILIQDDSSGSSMSVLQVNDYQTAYNNGVTFWFSVDDLSTQAAYTTQMQTLCGITTFSDSPDATGNNIIFNKVFYPNGFPTNVNGLTLSLLQSDHDSVTVGSATYLDQTNPGHYCTIRDGGKKFVLFIGETLSSITNYGTSTTQSKLLDSFIKMWIGSQIGDLSLTNGQGTSGKICLAKYKPYTFNASVLAENGLTNISYVNITLDYGPGEENLKFSWDQELDTFTEVSDPNNYAEIVSTNSNSTSNGVDKWFIDFKIIFNWSYPDEDGCDAFLEIEHADSTINNMTIAAMFRIENDMMFRAPLSVTAEYQGVISNGGWVIGSEQVNWTGFKVFYQGSTSDYVNGSYFNVSITDDDTGLWKDSPGTGQSFFITTQADPVNDPSDVHDIDIVDMPAGPTDMSNKNFTLRVDTINVTFADPIPYSGGWATGSTPPCWITINDTSGSGVNITSIEYRNSTSGPGNYGPWLDANLTGPKTTSYQAVAYPSFIVGTNNYIQWRALDAVGNGYNVSGDVQIKIEITPPDESGATVEIDGGVQYSTDTTLDFTWVGFTDAGGSGLEGYYYAFNNNETTPNGTWDLSSPGQLANSDQGPVSVFVWARDHAGNIGNSVSDLIFVDSLKPNLDNILPTSNQWQKTATVGCSIMVNDTLLGAGINITSVRYRISTSGTSNYGGWLSAGAAGSGNFIPVTVNPTFLEGTDNYIQWRAKDIVDNEQVSGHNQLKIDLTDLTFGNPQPVNWQTTQKVICGINIDDLGGSGVNLDTIEYASSTTGTTGYGNWINLGRTGVMQDLYVYTSVTFAEGTNNYIKWRAADLSGNSVETPDLQILVDTINITFKNPMPVNNIWHTANIVTCGITVEDLAGSTVNASSISYRYSTFGIGNYSEWISAAKTGDLETIICSEIVNFYDGTDNYIKWGAKDVAGNWYESPDYQINIDTGNLSFLNPAPEFYEWNTDTDVGCSIDIKDSSVSGINYSSVQYQYKTSDDLDYSDWTDVDVSDISGTSSEILVEVTFTFTDGTENYVRWQAADIAGNSKISDPYKVLVDTQEINFQDPLPLSLQSVTGGGWEHELRLDCGITVNDTVSGVDASSIEYSFSTTGSTPTSFGDWIPVSIIKDGLIINCNVELEFLEGTNNYLMWRAKDVAGNGYTTSNIYQLKIDTQDVTFSGELPKADEWQSGMQVEFVITIEDNVKGSGINVDSIKYAISNEGISGYSDLNYGDWIVAVNDDNTEITTAANGLSSICSVDLTVSEGVSNYIKWYAEDYAGNGLVSKNYQTIVDSNGLTFYNPSPDPTKWQTGGTSISCEIYVMDDGASGFDVETIEYSFSKTGIGGFGNWKDDWVNLETDDDNGNNEPEGVGLIKLSTPILSFLEGTDNYVKWRGYDLAGNYQESPEFQIMIDTLPVTYLDAKVTDRQSDSDVLTFTFEVKLDDNSGSGVDVSSIEFAMSPDGKHKYDEWESLWDGALGSIPSDVDVYTVSLTESVLIEGAEAYIKFRAMDVAGNQMINFIKMIKSILWARILTMTTVTYWSLFGPRMFRVRLVPVLN